MKAIIQRKYGSEEVLEYTDTQKPEPKENEVLIRIHAASMTYSTLVFMKGKPRIMRLFTGLRKPKLQIPGCDIAGTIESCGKDVKDFNPGDKVYGDLSNCGRGGFAEYVCATEKNITRRPENISAIEAAAVPEAALVALQALREKGRVKQGQKVLIYGGSGGIGTFAVQLAKYFGAEVSAVCSTKNIEMVKRLGADHVIDYTKDDFLKQGVKYDLIVATSGYRSIYDYKRALKPKGIYVATGGAMAQSFQALLLGPWVSMFSSKKLMSLLVKPNLGLSFIKNLIEKGKIKPVIDRHYSLSETADAVNYYDQGHSKGKVIIDILKG